MCNCFLTMHRLFFRSCVKFVIVALVAVSLVVCCQFRSVISNLHVLLKQELVIEKETKMRESMLMMGCKLRVIWMTWYTKQIVFLLPSVLFISIILKVS